MREIKFRIWNCHGQVMHQWPELVKGDKIHLLDKQQPTYKVMQYTGLKDKNGLEIYEGDILHHQIQGNRKVIYPMSDNFAGFGLESTEGKKNTLQDSSYLYEVVGNIHQNPELLEK